MFWQMIELHYEPGILNPTICTRSLFSFPKHLSGFIVSLPLPFFLIFFVLIGDIFLPLSHFLDLNQD